MISNPIQGYSQERVLFSKYQQFEPIARQNAGSIRWESDRFTVVSLRKQEEPWAIQLQTPRISTPIGKGEVLCFSFEARSLDEEGVGLATIHFAQADPWKAINQQDAIQTIMIPSAWKQYHCCARAESSFRAHQVYMTMHLANQKQSIDIRNPTLKYLGAIKEDRLPISPMTYEGRDQGAAWRVQAEARIERHRKSELVVQVVDERNQPLDGAMIRVRQKRHRFAFGTFTDAILEIEGEDARRYKSTMKTMFNRVTLPRYWADWGTDQASGIETSDRIAEWAKREGFQLKTHVLLYPKYIPERVQKMKHRPELFRASIEQAMEDALERTKDLPCVAWDALNETRDDPWIRKVLGDSFYAEVFKRAQSRQPNVRWFLNEYDIIEASPNRAANLSLFEETLRRIRRDGGPVEGIGLQGHFSSLLPSMEEIEATLDRLGKFQLPIEITEFDINIRDTQAQGDFTRDFLTLAFSHPAIQGVTIWGFWEGKIWQPNAAMIRKDWTIKPNGKAWQELVLKRWWTDERQRSSLDGLARFRPFQGTHEIEVTWRSKRVVREIDLGTDPQTIAFSIK